jgi:pyruvate/2-oxoglutarate dehydrogenase complex dihydrolipoamide acyltransferase (E2) component
MARKVIMPQLGESVVEGTVTKWLKAEGEEVQELEALLEINTDKVDSEIPSPAGGFLLRIVVPEGQTVRAGTVLAWIGTREEPVPAGGEGNVGNEAQPVRSGNGHERPGGSAAPAGRSAELGFISPVVARIARENNVDLGQVKGSGSGGRITKRDVLDYLEHTPRPGGVPPTEAPAWETPADGDLFRPTEMVFGKEASRAERTATAPAVEVGADVLETELTPLSAIRRLTAAHMQASKESIPHVTTVMEADLSRVVAHRAANQAAFNRDGGHLTYTAYFAAAAVSALRAFPMVNSSWAEEGIRVHRQINLGLATALGEEGLIVPVIRRAEGLSLLGLAGQINDLAGRARAGRLRPDEVQGGTFTITNHGTSGSLFATPIIPLGQCAILGVGAIQKRAVVVEAAGGVDAIAIRPMVYLGLTFDHRILDGAAADGFLAKVVETLQNWV